MAHILINQKLFADFAKFKIETPALVSLNNKFAQAARNVRTAVPVSGMTLADTDDVVRWSIDYSLGVVGGPYRRQFTVGPIQEVPNPIFDPIGPIANQPFEPRINTGINPLQHVISLPTSKALIDGAAISSGIKRGTAPMAVQALKPFLQSVSTNDTPVLNHVRVMSDRIEFGNGTVINPGPFIDPRPEWEKEPNMWIIPKGFPQTESEVALSRDTFTILHAFYTRTTAISTNMTTRVRSSLPSWRIPKSDNIDWKNPDQRFNFLKSCDTALFKADTDSKSIMQDSILTLLDETQAFHIGALKYIYCSPDIFRDYINGQVKEVLKQAWDNQNMYIAQQQYIINNLKTQLSQLDFQQRTADAAAAQAQQQQEHHCTDIFKKPLFWIIVVATGVALVTVPVIIGGSAGKKGTGDPSGPWTTRDPYDPNTE